MGEEPALRRPRRPDAAAAAAWDWEFSPRPRIRVKRASSQLFEHSIEQRRDFDAIDKVRLSRPLDIYILYPGPAARQLDRNIFARGFVAGIEGIWLSGIIDFNNAVG